MDPFEVFAVGDSHFDESSRFDECVRLHEQIAGDASVAQPYLLIHSGDVYECESTPKERLAVFHFFQEVSRASHVLVVRGNHDKVHDVEAIGSLSPLTPDTTIRSTEMPRVVDYDLVRVVTLPWPDYGSLLAATGKSGPEAGEFAKQGLRDVLRALGSESARWRKDGVPTILSAHAMVTGSVTSSGQPLIGTALELGLEDLMLADPDLVLLAHVHRQQSWSWTRDDGVEVPIIYSGSPRRTNFGETEAKGYISARWDGRRFTTRFVELDATPMLLVESRWTANGGFDNAAELEALLQSASGAEIRFRYTVAAENAADAKAASRALREKLLELGAINVKLDPIVEVAARARESSFTSTSTTEDKLRAYWSSKGFAITPEREQRLFAKVAQMKATAK